MSEIEARQCAVSVSSTALCTSDKLGERTSTYESASVIGNTCTLYTYIASRISKFTFKIVIRVQNPNTLYYIYIVYEYALINFILNEILLVCFSLILLLSKVPDLQYCNAYGHPLL